MTPEEEQAEFDRRIREKWHLGEYKQEGDDANPLLRFFMFFIAPGIALYILERVFS